MLKQGAVFDRALFLLLELVLLTRRYMYSRGPRR
jgi:hypothetical protein